MARLILALAVTLLPLAAAQNVQDEQFKKAGVCGRCHVISVVEWGMSRHVKAGTDCVACHGASQGHVADERNNVKPERVPRGAAIRAFCLDCHPKQSKSAACQNCHHVHALIVASKVPAVPREPLDEAAGETARQAKRRAEAERLARLPREIRAGGIELVLIPGGEFDMGSDRFPVAQPVHTIRVRPFYLGKFEVTEAERKAIMGGNPSPRQGDRLPVEQVSWEDAQAFLRKLNETAPGRGFRLPTEAEWEFAARSGAASGAVLQDVAWFYAEGRAEGPQPVGGRKPNKLGLFDMQGNVWEWCSSLALPYPYSALDGRESATASGLRILRGGGYLDAADLLDPGMRHAERPSRRLPGNGLRVAAGTPE